MGADRPSNTGCSRRARRPWCGVWVGERLAEQESVLRTGRTSRASRCRVGMATVPRLAAKLSAVRRSDERVRNPPHAVGLLVPRRWRPAPLLGRERGDRRRYGAVRRRGGTRRTGGVRANEEWRGPKPAAWGTGMSGQLPPPAPPAAVLFPRPGSRDVRSKPRSVWHGRARYAVRLGPSLHRRGLPPRLRRIGRRIP